MHIFNVNMLLFRSRTTKMSSSDFQKGDKVVNNICHFELNRFIDVEHEIGNLLMYFCLVVTQFIMIYIFFSVYCEMTNYGSPTNKVLYGLLRQICLPRL